MFNSQKINNDPFLFEVTWEDGFVNRYATLSMAMEKASLPGRSYRRAPRPEYDNNPNPILLRFRRYCDKYPRVTLAHAAEDFLWVNSGGFTLDKWDYSKAHWEHARKVLERLVNVYG